MLATAKQRRPSPALTSALSTLYPRKSLHPHNGSTPDDPPHTTTRPATTQVGLHEDEKPSERYRAKKTLHTDTLVMMECKLWLCKILSLLCTVRLDIRLSKLLARYAMGRVSDGQQAGHGPRLFLSPRSSSRYYRYRVEWDRGDWEEKAAAKEEFGAGLLKFGAGLGRGLQGAFMSPRGGDSPGRQYERLQDEPDAAGTETSRTAPPGLELSRMESSVSMISSKADSPGGSPGGRRMPRRGSVRPHTHRSRTRSFFGSGDENERRREKEREKSFASMFDVLKLELDTSGNGEDDFVPVLMDLTFYDHKELVSSALGLLVRHFEQRTVLKNAGLQVMGRHHLYTTTSTPQLSPSSLPPPSGCRCSSASRRQ